MFDLQRVKTAQSLPQIFSQLFHDQSGFVVTIELVLCATVVVIGLIVGHVTIRDALNCELSDIAGALQDLNQSFEVQWTDSDGVVHTASYVDTTDHCDEPGDPVGLADNCITFTLEPADEAEPKEFHLSDIGDQVFTDVDSGFGGSATGTIGDGADETTFNVTTDTGQILGTSGNKISFRESPNAEGTFTTTFADPLTDVELWVQNLANNDNLLGNFTVTLSDGTVLNNAAFTVIPDAIAPNSSYGEFTTSLSDRESLQTVTVGGNQYVTDPTSNGGRSQAAGRIVFTDVPTAGPSPGNPVGITSISFERSGGPANFRAFFGFSGRVIVCD